MGTNAMPARRVAGRECQLCRARATCFFSTLKGVELEEFRAACIANVYRKRQVVFYEGHLPHGVFIVCSGRVKVYKSDHKGHQLTVRIAAPGELLGYRALLAREPYSATAEALEDSCLSYLGEESFRRFLSRPDGLGARMLEQLSRDVRMAEDKARDMVMKSSRERLAALLLMLHAAQEPATRTKRAGPIVLPYTRQELGEMAGLAQETVIRLLTELARSRVIALEGRRLTILDAAALERRAGTTV